MTRSTRYTVLPFALALLGAVPGAAALASPTPAAAQQVVSQGADVYRLRIGAVPVLALSANAAFADIRRGRAAGFLAYLTKPLQIPALVEALSRALTPDVEPRSDVDAA